MASSRASGNPPPSAPLSTSSSSLADTFLNRKKKEIIDKSMALFQKNLDRCLDQCSDSVPAAASGGGGPGATGGSRKKPLPRVLGKRARAVSEEADEQRFITTTTTTTTNSVQTIAPTAQPVKTSTAAAAAAAAAATTTTRKKRIKPSPPTGPLFACPFCKHNPEKYRHVKTCCGPGWEDVHRVKEHVYRNHSSRNYCSRCLERFDNEESLKSHQRAEVPCRLEKDKNKLERHDVISDSQEKQLRTRAKPGSSEEDKWREMYNVIFPEQCKKGRMPSCYYNPVEDLGVGGGGGGAAKGTEGNGGVPKTTRFGSIDDCKEFLRAELPRLVRPMITQFVESLFEDFQERVNKKTIEIVRDVETRMLRTFQYQEDQAVSVTGGEGVTTPPDSLVDDHHFDHHHHHDHSQLYEPGVAGGMSSMGVEAAGVPSETSKMNQLFEDLRRDSTYMDMCGNLQYNVEDLIAESEGLFTAGAGAGDSAYFTGPDGSFLFS